jgi:pimeloyl-ACP methyl ester carboxylesterase
MSLSLMYPPSTPHSPSPFTMAVKSDWALDHEYFERLKSVEEQFAHVRTCDKTDTDITIAYHTFGNPDDPCVLLVRGLNSQCPLWDVEFCESLVAKSFFVVRYDNRDIGLSTKLDHCGSPGLFTLLTGGCCCCGGGGSITPYLLVDMAADAIALLDHLHIDKAHIVGISMGGMLAQTMAIEFPHRVASMTSISSTTGGPDRVDPGISMKLFLAKEPKSNSEEHIAEYHVEIGRRTGGPRAFNEDRCYTRGMYLSRRSRYGDGCFRHAGAMVFSPSRVQDLGRLSMPCLVIHGDKDEVVPPVNGVQTNAAIPGSKLVIIPDMGHVLMEEDIDTIVGELHALAKKQVAHSAGAGNELPSTEVEYLTDGMP